MTDSGSDPDLTDEATRAVDEDDARAAHAPDRPPTEDEEAAAAAAGTEVPESVADAYQEAAQTGAQVEGEGQI
ncbi:MAG TPA: hypothetical protein VEW93_14815 [Acidimicrobiales bacterium]|nr:hypothetical protein [Acidimicrobiales bacterium]